MNDHANQAFEQMKRVALEWLKDRDPHEIAKNAGITYDEARRVYTFSSMGSEITLTYPDYRISPEIGTWHYLLILHYLYLADGTELSGDHIPFGQMKGGLVRGGGIDRKCEETIRAMKDPDESKLAKICEHMGGQKMGSNADISYRIPFLPNFPVTINIWLPDEEFPASGRLLVDESADHYFSIEDAVTVAEIILERIAVPAEQRSFTKQ